MTPQVDTRIPHKAQAGRTVVVGLGRTGMSCARYLRSRGVDFAVTDSRTSPPEAAALRQLAPDADVAFGGFDTSLLDGATEIVASPGVSLREPFLERAAARGVPIIGDIELFAREARAPVVAITGTNGKSTVTTLVARMAESAGKRTLAGGNLGRPALELLEQPVPELYVLELSSFQLDTTQSLRTSAATVLNVTPDHMDRYDTIADYAASKARVFANCAAAIVNLDDPLVREMGHAANTVIGFSLLQDPAANYYAQDQGGDVVLMQGREPVVKLSEMKITGMHNAANALASLAMADALGLDRERCVQTLREFPGLAHRSQWVADVNGVRYIDDSKGTNVGATLAAVAGMPGSLVVIAGGQGKGQDFAPLAPAFRGKVRHVVLLGQDAKLIAAALEGVATVEFAADMPEAVKLSERAAHAGETVLLSPACASLDMFRDYAHRGDAFAAAVRELQA
jgi:UDP-N-acetylmuramoylalanine--D-glutamate ligase